MVRKDFLPLDGGGQGGGDNGINIRVITQCPFSGGHYIFFEKSNAEFYKAIKDFLEEKTE